MTSALSVLKELVHRRMRGEDQEGKFVWFVWSCRRVDDLLWVWRTLEKTLQDACREGAIELDDDWCPWTSNMLDWLSITIYISRADRKALDYFLDASSGDESKLPEDAVLKMHQSSEDYLPIGDKAETAPPPSPKPAANKWKKAVAAVRFVGNTSQPSRRITALKQANAMPRRGPTVRGRVAGGRASMAPAAAGNRLAPIGDAAVAETNKVGLFPSAQGGKADEDFDNYQLCSSEGGDDDDGDQEDAFTWLDRQVKAAKPVRELAAMYEKGGRSSAAAEEEESPVPPAKAGEPTAASGVTLVEEEEDATYCMATRQRSTSAAARCTRVDDFIMGAMTRHAADALLQNWNVAGGFLVRYSDKNKSHIFSYLPVAGKPAVHMLLHEDGATQWVLHDKPLGAPCADLTMAVAHLMKEGHELLPVTLIQQLPQRDQQQTPLQKAAMAVVNNPTDRLAKRNLKRVLEAHLKEKAEADVHTWLQQQVMDASMDHKDGHIANLLLWVKSSLAEEKNGKGGDPRMAVCFCGPSMLASMISEAAAAVGGDIEFNAEFQ